MKSFSNTNIYSIILSIIIIGVGVYIFIVFFNQNNSGQIISNISLSQNVNTKTYTNAYNSVYQNEDLKMQLDIPVGMVLDEVKSGNLHGYYFGNPKPNLSLFIHGLLPEPKEGDPIRTPNDTSYFIVFYKDGLNQPNLLGNYLNIEPDLKDKYTLSTISKGQITINEEKFNFLQSTTKFENLQMFEITGVLANGITVYAIEYRNDRTFLPIKDNDPGLHNLKKIIGSLRFK